MLNRSVVWVMLCFGSPLCRNPSLVLLLANGTEGTCPRGALGICRLVQLCVRELRLVSTPAVHGEKVGVRDEIAARKRHAMQPAILDAIDDIAARYGLAMRTALVRVDFRARELVATTPTANQITHGRHPRTEPLFSSRTTKQSSRGRPKRHPLKEVPMLPPQSNARQAPDQQIQQPTRPA